MYLKRHEATAWTTMGGCETRGVHTYLAARVGAAGPMDAHVTRNVDTLLHLHGATGSNK